MRVLKQLLNLLDVIIDNAEKKSSSCVSEEPNHQVSTSGGVMNVVSTVDSGEGSSSLKASASDEDKEKSGQNVLNDLPKAELQLDNNYDPFLHMKVVPSGGIDGEAAGPTSRGSVVSVPSVSCECSLSEESEESFASSDEAEGSPSASDEYEDALVACCAEDMGIHWPNSKLEKEHQTREPHNSKSWELRHNWTVLRKIVWVLLCLNGKEEVLPSKNLLVNLLEQTGTFEEKVVRSSLVKY